MPRTRKLATIVALDVAGYSARTEVDEAKATSEVVSLRGTIEAIATAHAGRIFNNAGDGFMLEFSSSLAAVEAACELAATCRPKVRVGVHLGDVVVQANGDLLGHGVNIAARLMAHAAPGAVLVSAAVRQTIRGPLVERFVSQGKLQLDKMTEQIEAFALGESAPIVGTSPSKKIEPLLAVLAFDNLSGDPEMQFFSEGVSEEIRHSVARGTAIKVIGRSSSFQFRGPDKAVAKVAAALKCTHVLDGAVRRSGERVRIGAQLVDAATQTTLWSESFDRDLKDIFLLQDEIAAAVAEALQHKFSTRSAAVHDPFAYDLFLRARSLMVSGTQSGYDAANVLLAEAVRRVPKFAQAWGALSLAKGFLRRYEREPGKCEALMRAARDAADTALSLDPKTTLAYWTLNFLAPYGANVERLAIAERASLSAPNDAPALALFCLGLGHVGRMRESMRIADKAYALDPLDWSVCSLRALSLSARGDDDAGLALQDEIVSRWPETPSSTGALIMWRAIRGDWKWVDEFLAPERLARLPLTTYGAFNMAVVSMLRDPNAKTRSAVIHEARMAFRSGLVFPIVCCARVGMVAEIFDVIDEWEISTDSSVTLFARSTGPLFFPNLCGGEIGLRRDPRFARLCVRFGLAKYWLETQSWPDCAEEVGSYYNFKRECAKAAADGPWLFAPLQSQSP